VPSRTTEEARTVPPTALARKLPTLRHREFRPLAAASSSRGAARAIKAGMAA
jgi:hypothetical protein